jgi:UDP-N-acetylglucosamine--N-acetylmuramyl-(pentapeptide) pyrophosphoryl-undecaprenol N-acetylglucosamine transferase
MILAGGTGGHVYPALAVAQELRRRGHQIVWMGAAESFESRVVPRHGIPLETIRVSGLRGKGLRSLPKIPLMLARAYRDASAALRRTRPQIVLGMGGFAAGPGGLAARWRRLPLVIHEQNAVAGLTNRLLARIADGVLQAFPDTFANGRTVGNPVRAGFADLPDPQVRIGSRRGRSRVLVVGGSLGARALNEIVPEALALLDSGKRPEVLHQAGRTLAEARAAYESAGASGKVVEFIEDMPQAMGWADLVICRAGASTVTELATAGCAALLVPFPFAVDDHQTRNARYLVAAGAAELIPQRELTPENLAGRLRELLADRSRLSIMAQSARTVAWPHATQSIADACVEAAC